MLSISMDGFGAIDPMLGFMPNLREGSDYRMGTTRSGPVALALTAPVLAMFKSIQVSINQVGQLMGMPLSLTVDGKMGNATGSALKLVVNRLDPDLQRNLSPEAKAGQAAGVAKDARNVLGTLQEAAVRRDKAPALPVAAVAPLPPVAPSPAPTRLQLPDIKSNIPLVRPAITPVSQRFVSTADERKKMSTGVFVGVLAAFLLAGGAAAVLVARRD